MTNYMNNSGIGQTKNQKILVANNVYVILFKWHYLTSVAGTGEKDHTERPEFI